MHPLHLHQPWGVFMVVVTFARGGLSFADNDRYRERDVILLAPSHPICDVCKQCCELEFVSLQVEL